MRFLRLFAFLICIHQQAEAQLPAVSDLKTEVLQCLEKANAYLPAHTDSAFLLAKQAEQMATENALQDELAQSAQILGQVFFAEAAYNQALEYFLKAEQIWEIYPNAVCEAANFNHLGNLYSQLKRDDKILAYHRQALSLYHRLNHEFGIAATFGFIGHYYEKNGSYDSALNYQQRALAIYRKSGFIEGKSLILENIGSIYEDLGNYYNARQYFTESLELNKAFGDELVKIRLLNNLGDICYKTHRYKEAENYMYQALMLAKKQNDRYQIRSVYRDLAQLFAAQQNHQLAYEYLDSSVVLYKQIYSEEGLRQVARLETFFETEKKNREITLLEKDKRISQLIVSLIAAGLGIVVILGITLIGRQRMKLRQNKKLYETRQQLLQSQLKNHQLNQRQLKDELDNKSRSLTAYSLHLMQKNQVLKQVQSELKVMSKPDMPNPRKHLRTLSNDIDSSFTRDKDWDDFRVAFEEVHPSFFENLSLRNPDISQAELKLAALMKMRLSSRDTATILGISTDSLRIARYRLRKKLNLEKDQKLGAFLQSI